MSDIKLRVFDDGSLLIVPHKFYPTKNMFLLPKNPFRESQYSPPLYMTKKDYSLTLKRIHNNLFHGILSKNNPLFLTLTFKDIIPLKQVYKEFHKFIVYITRHFNKAEYIRAFEFHEKDNRLHIHVLLSFKFKPKGLTKQYLEKHIWKVGSVDIKRVNSFMGTIQYLTTFKESNLQENNNGLTKFPKGTRIISMSNSFIQDKKPFNDYFINFDTYKSILQKYRDVKKQGGFIRKDIHYYFNDTQLESKECIDRIFIRPKR